MVSEIIVVKIGEIWQHCASGKWGYIRFHYCITVLQRVISVRRLLWLVSLIFSEFGRSQRSTRDHLCNDNACAICLEDAVSTMRTRCCGQLLHSKCLEELRRNAVRKQGSAQPHFLFLNAKQKWEGELVAMITISENKTLKVDTHVMSLTTIVSNFYCGL